MTAPTLYQFLWYKIAMTTLMTGRTQAGWVEQVGRETGIPGSFKKTRSTPTRCQASIRRLGLDEKKVAMILIQAMALALKPPLRFLAREKAPEAEQPTRPVPQLNPFLFQLCRR
jgi:hypothetical protein